jgi:hypothetical protein
MDGNLKFGSLIGRGGDTAFLLGYPHKGVLSPAPAKTRRHSFPRVAGIINNSTVIPALRRHIPSRAVLILLFPFCLGLPGCCCWTDNSGTRHTLIIGLGVVSVNESKSEAAQVVRANALGVIADAGGFTAGFSSRFTTSVPAGAEDVRIEASQQPFAPLKIEVQKAQSNQINQGDKHP